MSFLWGRKKPKPDATLLDHLERIGELKDGLSLSERGACNVLGLYVQLQSVPPLKGQLIGADTLQAGSQTVSYLDAWRAALPREEWKVEKYEPGECEKLVQPTLRLAEWLDEWGGLYEDNEATFRSAVSEFQRTGELGLLLRSETGKRLCGRCGAEVSDIEEHVVPFHVHQHPNSPLAAHVVVAKGKMKVALTEGLSNRGQKYLPKQLYGEDMSGDPRYRPGLHADLWEVLHLNTGHLAPFVGDGKYLVPDDITSFPHLARALRELVRTKFTSHWKQK